MPSRASIRRVLRNAMAVSSTQALGLLGALILAAPAAAQTSYVRERVGAATREMQGNTR